MSRAWSSETKHYYITAPVIPANAGMTEEGDERYVRFSTFPEDVP